MSDIKYVITVDNRGGIKALKQFHGELDETPKSAAKADKGISRLTKTLGALGAAFAVREIVQFSSSVVRMGANAGMAALRTADAFEGMRIQLTNLRGSSKQAESDFQWIRTFAKTTPLELANVTDTFNQMVAYGIEPTTGSMQALVDMSFKYGKGTETLTSMTLALGKAWGKGKIEAEEWNMMAERGIPIGRLLSEMLGVNESALFKMRKEGKLTREVIGDLIDYMGSDAAGAAASQMNRLSNLVVNLKDVVTDMLGEIGSGAATTNAQDALKNIKGLLEEMDKNGAIDAMTQSFADFTKSISDLSLLVRANGQDITKFVVAISGAMSIISKTNSAAIKALTNATKDAVDVTDMLVSSHETYAERVARLNAENAQLQLEIVGVTTRLKDLSKGTDEVVDEGAAWLAGMKDIEFQAGLVAGELDHWSEWAKRDAKTIADRIYDIDHNIEGIEPPPVSKFSQAFDDIGSSFSDLLGKGFTGELESFSDLWDEIWQDLAKSMTGILGDAFEGWMSGGREGGVGGLFGSFADKIEENRIGAGIGGAGMMYQGNQQGGSGGAVMGALGGAMAGFAVGGPIGAAIGAGVGLLAGIFGGSDKPESAGYIGFGGGAVSRTQGQGLPDREAAWLQFSTERVQEYRTAVRGMNDILRLFGDGSLFDMIGDPATWNFNGSGSLDSFAAVFREQWLPDAMRQMFEGAINQGLGNLGVSDDTLTQLWGELEGLTGSNRIVGLETFISSLVGVTDLYAEMDWNTLLDESRMDSFTSFVVGMGEMVDAVQMQMLGLGGMTLLERAEQAQTVEQMITQARQAEIQMLRQIDALQTGINRSIDQQIEGIQTGGMTSAQQTQYYEQQVMSIMGQLRGGIGSPEELQQLMGDLQRYIGLLQGSLGDGLYELAGPWSTETWAEQLIGILEEARGLSDNAFEEMRDQVRETNEALITQLELLISALTDFTGVLTDDPGSVGAGGGRNQEALEGNQKGATVNLTVIPNDAPLVDFIYSVVDSRIGGDPNAIQ